MLYYGEESKEIGIFKFKVGLFKFALPTFAKEEWMWEDHGDGSRWKTVPVPPNRLRKNTSRREIIKKSSSLDATIKIPQQIGATEDTTSVAYVAILPSFHSLQKSNNLSILRERAAVLAASIKNAYANSSHKYQLYAIKYYHPSNRLDDKIHRCNDECKEIFTGLGYKIVDVSMSDLDEGRQSRLAGSYEITLDHILTNSIVVHLSLNSFLLKPIDHSVFDLIVSKTRDADSGAILALKPSTATTNRSMDEPLYIFKPSSNEATTSYLEFLKCSTDGNSINTKHPSPEDNNTNSQRREVWQPTLFPKMRKLLDAAVPKSLLKHVDSDPEGCAITKTMAVLDRCIYAIGSEECNAAQEGQENDYAVAAFFGGECAKPWECERTPAGDTCIDNSQDETAHCEWLHQKWFALSKGM